MANLKVAIDRPEAVAKSNLKSHHTFNLTPAVASRNIFNCVYPEKSRVNKESRLYQGRSLATNDNTR